jgi:4-oxalocrotonate tautomerase
MPYVNIKVTKEEMTDDKKRQLIKGVTNLLCEVLNKDPRSTTVIIDEIDPSNWGVAGMSAPEFRKSNLFWGVR